ncbi:hypothetical protein Aglo01_02810 [Actinokineospora globicatena]|uniref:Uncharacterized protein n=1 Tax=Actinokineospora globicatena TaxID=103729 RepID=A0A9W6QK91_9PSEU|nr:hypothetical protein Aglo01_02810 [Actinokineospora globicatena]GLW91586.1 hypothetical protein Aglo03_24020 [Actinokineospora globicatena]
MIADPPSRARLAGANRATARNCCGTSTFGSAPTASAPTSANRPRTGSGSPDHSTTGPGSSDVDDSDPAGGSGSEDSAIP